MSLPIHPLVTHLPLGLSVLIPLLILVFMILIKLEKVSPKLWMIVLGFQVLMTVSGYITIETGETEEEIVKEVVGKKNIALHEADGEKFVGATVITLVLSIGSFFIDPKFRFRTHIAVLLASIFSFALAVNVGRSGAELVYKHGAGEAYLRNMK